MIDIIFRKAYAWRIRLPFLLPDPGPDFAPYLFFKSLPFYSPEQPMRRRPACLFFAVFAAILILLDAAGCPLIPEPHIRSPRNGHAALKGWVFSCEKSGRGSRSILRGTAVGRISLFVSGEQDFPAGTPLLAEGVLERAKKPENPGGYDEALYLKVRGIFYTMYHPELSPWKDAPKRSFLQLASDTVKEIQGKARSAARRRYPIFKGGPLFEHQTDLRR